MKWFNLSSCLKWDENAQRYRMKPKTVNVSPRNSEKGLLFRYRKRLNTDNTWRDKCFTMHFNSLHSLLTDPNVTASRISNVQKSRVIHYPYIIFEKKSTSTLLLLLRIIFLPHTHIYIWGIIWWWQKYLLLAPKK